MKKIINHLAILLLFISQQTLAQGYLEFTQNKGQWDSEILYQGKVGNGLFSLTKSGYKVMQYHAGDYATYVARSHNHDLPPVTVRGHVWDVKFEGANTNLRTIPTKAVEGISNYYIGDDPSKWASGCKSFINVKYENIYPNIDVEFYTDKGTLKYDIIVKPGGNPDLIKLNYGGDVKLKKGKGGSLIVETSVGEFMESAPFTFQVGDYSKKVINAGYVINNNSVRFKFADYDKSKPLIIDPTLVFSTHSGSTADNWGFTATYDFNENFYGGGFVEGNGYPVTAGAFQTSFGGGIGGSGNQATDIAITKLNPNGTTRLYSTYIGGSGNEQPHSMVCDAAGNLVVAGRTTSPNFPNNGINGTRGLHDIYILKLNANGTALIGSMIFAGSGEDGVNISTTRARSSLQYNYGDDGRSEVNLDAQGNIILASCTRSANFFTTAGVIQTSLSGSQDAVIIKTNPNVSAVLFSTLLGGSGDDAAYVIDAGPDGNYYIAGGTSSSNLPNTAGTVQPAYAGGNADGFITVLSNTGTSVVRTTYVGTSSHDQIYGIKFDRQGFPYIMGLSLGNFPVINAAYSNPGSHQIIAKLARDLSSYVYTTKFGTNTSEANISPVAFLVDNCENVYVSGWGGGTVFGTTFTSAGTNNLPITSDAIQSTTDGKDFYYFVLEKNAASLLFGSFFGGIQTTQASEHVDGGTSRFDPRGTIYQAACASCGVNSGLAQYPSTPGTVSPNNRSSNCNLGMTKIRFNYQGVKVDLKVSDTIGCNPLTVSFRDEFQNAVSYIYIFGDGTPPVATTQSSRTHTYTTPGVYTMMLIGVNLNACVQYDTAFVKIRVRHPAATLDFNGIKQPPCTNLTYVFNNLSVPSTKPFTSTSFRWDFGDGTGVAATGTAPQTKTYAAPGTYIVKLFLIDTNYCNFPDSVVKTFRLSTTTKADFTINNGCQPHTPTITNTSVSALTYQWDFGNGATSTAQVPNYTYTTPGTYIVTLIVRDPNTCNITDTLKRSITVYPKPTANFTYSPNPSQINTPTQFTNLSLNATSYKWIFGDGDSSTLTNPLHQYLRTDTFNTCLYAINNFGCRDTVCRDVPAYVEPLIDVPTAITPNGDGVNDIVIPRGFGITKITFRVYNRWGALIFETRTPGEGWDGKSNGVLQPMDAYGYTLQAEFFNGDKVKKSGNISLIR